jgi:hypothetical protein
VNNFTINKKNNFSNENKPYNIRNEMSNSGLVISDNRDTNKEITIIIDNEKNETCCKGEYCSIF